MARKISIDQLGKGLSPTPGKPSCPGCGAGLVALEIQTIDFVKCTSCGAPRIFHAFPALIQPQREHKSGESLSVEGEASCYNHANKKAELACDRCGRFICGLCEIKLGPEQICPACFNGEVSTGKSIRFQRSRVLYDSIALWLSLGPPLSIVLLFFTFITAPISLFIAIRYWNTPMSVLGRTKVRFILAIIFSLLQIGVWAFYVISLFNL